MRTLLRAREALPFHVSRDGQRFLLIAAPKQASVAPLTPLTNWHALLKRRAQ